MKISLQEADYGGILPVNPIFAKIFIKKLIDIHH